MTILHAPTFDNTNFDREPPLVSREFHASLATALDARKYPIIAKHFGGLLLIDGRLALNGNAGKGVRHETA